MSKEPIFVVGLPACGKSTFGRALAKRLGRRFIDLDRYIENRFHTTVQALFAERGEEEFRRLETAMLREVGEFEEVVVSTGGGAPCHSANMDYMTGRGPTVWLQASLPRIRSRIALKPAKRPLLAGLDEEALMAKLRKLEEVRSPYYSAASIHFATDFLEDRRQIFAAVETFLARHPFTPAEFPT